MKKIWKNWKLKKNDAPESQKFFFKIFEFFGFFCFFQIWNFLKLLKKPTFSWFLLFSSYSTKPAVPSPLPFRFGDVVRVLGASCQHALFLLWPENWKFQRKNWNLKKIENWSKKIRKEIFEKSGNENFFLNWNFNFWEIRNLEKKILESRKNENHIFEKYLKIKKKNMNLYF